MRGVLAGGKLQHPGAPHESIAGPQSFLSVEPFNKAPSQRDERHRATG